MPNFFPDYIYIDMLKNIHDPAYPLHRIMDYLFFDTDTICAECKQIISFKLIRNKLKGDYFTMRCGCGMKIVYPESKERNNKRLMVYIKREDYDGRNKKRGNDNGRSQMGSIGKSGIEAKGKKP